MRRHYPWGEVATMAQRAGGVWRLHPSLVAVTPDTLRHAQRRVRALRPTPTHRYEFARGNEGVDDIGRRVFDLYVRYIPEGIEP